MPPSSPPTTVVVLRLPRRLAAIHGATRSRPAVLGRSVAPEGDPARANLDDGRLLLGGFEDYRAGLTIDAVHEREDRDSGRRVQQPLLVLWSLRDDLEDLYGDPLAIWTTWADNVTGHGIDSGHHMAEEAPHALATALAGFLRPQPGRRSVLWHAPRVDPANDDRSGRPGRAPDAAVEPCR